jgi:LysR family transcriptional regulator, hydrogen peroxide-inducible genes activator
VVDRRHFGRAAEDCFIGQSTLSAGVQELEDLLGVILLERTQRSVTPTPIGIEIAERARALLKGAEDFLDVARAAQDPMSGSLQLGMVSTIGPFFIPRVIPRLRDAFPKLKIYLREEQTAPLLARLETGRLDAAVLALPYPLGDVETEEFAQDRFFVVCPSGHRFGALAAVRPDDLAMEDLLLLEDGHCMRDHALAACALEGARRNVAFQGTSLQTLVQMVANGLGVTETRREPKRFAACSPMTPLKRLAMRMRRLSIAKARSNFGDIWPRMARTLGETINSSALLITGEMASVRKRRS